MTESTKEHRASYEEIFSRNIGILSLEEQERLRETRIAVLGMGGIGSPCFEVLVRTGVGAFSIVDFDVFETSNRNRQIFASSATEGQRKIDVAAEIAKSINETVEIATYLTVDGENVSDVLEGSSVVIHAIDQLRPCLFSSRAARERGIPIVEGWALPVGNVRVLTPETPSLEASYNLPTEGRDIDDISDAELRRMESGIIDSLAEIDGVREHYLPDALQRVRRGQTPSLAPMVWFTSVMMAIEAVKVCLGRGRLALGPLFTLYDPFRHRSPLDTGAA